MAAGNSVFEIILPVLLVLLVFGINIGVMWYVVSNRRKADALCKELITNQGAEIKMIAFATLVKSSFLNKKGLLVMFNDKLSFYPIGKGDRTEMAFPLISRINSPGGFWSIVPMKKLEIYLSDQKLTFTVSRTMSTVLLAGMERLAPALAAAQGALR